MNKAEMIAQQVATGANIARIWSDLVINVKDNPYKAKGDWNGTTGTDDTVAIQKAIDYAISIGKHEVTFPPGWYKYTVLTNTSGITFIGDGVTLTGTTPITLTSLAALKADVTQISINPTSSPFGADNTGVVDSTAAIQAAADYAFANGLTLGGVGTYKITGTITLRCNVNMPNAIFQYYGTGTAVIIGNSSVATTNLLQFLPSVYQMSKVWSSDVGVQLVNIESSKIYTQIVSDFGTGLYTTSFGRGTVYNTITIGHLRNNKVNSLLAPGDITAWVNENLFIGGRYSHFSSEGTAVSGVCHIQMNIFSGSALQPNNNTFLKPSVEGDVPLYTLDICGANNTFIQGRYEGAGTKRVIYRTVGGVSSRRNVILFGYESDELVITEESGSQWNEFHSTVKSVKSGNNGTAMQTWKNTSSANNPVYRILDTGVDPYDASSTIYSYQIGANKTEMKRFGDAFPRLRIDHGNAAIYFGDGTVDPTTKRIRYNTTGIQAEGNLHLTNNAWNADLLRLASYRMWIDSTGKLRSKNGDPTSDTDGTQFQYGAITSISSTPQYLGQFAVVGGLGYMAIGTSSSADWKQITN